MSGLGLKVQVTDGAIPDAINTALALQPERLLPVAGRAAAIVVREHLVALNEERHLDGGRNYYFQASRAVSSAVVGSAAVVSINYEGIAQRYFGGPIVPTDGHKWLTIPAREEAYEHRAGEFSDLHFVQFREGLAALVQNDQSSLGGRERGSVTERGRHKGEEAGGGVFYWLVRSVDQEPDPTVLPTDAEVTDAAVAAMGAVLARQTGGAN